jgi:hypothetical protein
MMFTYGDRGKVLSDEYHDFRAEATFDTYDIDLEFGDIDIERYDLDTVQPRIGNKESSYITETRVESEGGAMADVDIRTFDDIRD